MFVLHPIFTQTQDENDSVINYISSVRGLERLSCISREGGAKINSGISRTLSLLRKRKIEGRRRWLASAPLTRPLIYLDQEEENAIIDHSSAIRALERLEMISIFGQVDIRRGVMRLHRILGSYPIINAA